MKHSRGRRLRRLSMRCAVLFASVLTAGALAHTAQASTLAGETFTAGLPLPVAGDTVSVACGATSTDPFTYHAEGRASGPHSGRFVEDGTVVPNALGQIVSLDATFEIRSVPAGAVTVTGEKHFLGPPGDTAICGRAGVSNIETDQLCYRAEFADGSPDETGRSNLDLVHSSFPFFSFRETFTPDATVSCGACPDDEDEDGDGLTDSRESRFFTLLGNDDSDFDGIADGNDDGNGNGEDDEDEDDDEDDDCPDEDSDDDGEDDEDEDDDEDDDD